jgi:enolase-phosphatase E1
VIQAILTDIEGTTSSLAFVKEVLFPYSKSRLPEFVASHADEPAVAAALAEVRALAPEADSAAAQIRQLLAWIDEDKKLSPLKALQGMIWEAGYTNGDFLGHVYPDAARKLKEWKESGLLLFVFSSGSALAQRLLFSHTEFGDLTPLFTGFFDTRVGPKNSPAAYSEIVRTIGVEPSAVLFLSDIEAELDAAVAAGLRTCKLVRRPGLIERGKHAEALDFDNVSVSR